MSMLSRWTIGAIASKKARASAPVAAPIDSASGPVATITGPEAGRASARSRTISTFGCDCSRAVTASEKPWRSTASADPAGTLCASAEAMISEPSARISACRRPTALLTSSSERKLFEQTSSASPSVWCAGVISPEPRISDRRTFTPASASCQAASLPASPPPMMWTWCMNASVNDREAIVIQMHARDDPASRYVAKQQRLGFMDRRRKLLAC
jgi:hypothetical protein